LPGLTPLPGLPVLSDAAHAPLARPAAPRDEPRRAVLPLKAQGSR
jgi:hypothetical protein